MEMNKNNKFNFFKNNKKIINDKLFYFCNIHNLIVTIFIIVMFYFTITGLHNKVKMEGENKDSLTVSKVFDKTELANLMNKKLELIESLKKIDFSTMSDQIINNKLKSINYKLLLNNKESRYAIIALPNKFNDADSIKYSYGDSKISVTWRGVSSTSNDFEMFKEVWNSKAYNVQFTKTIEGAYDVQTIQEIPPMYKIVDMEKSKNIEKLISQIPENSFSSKSIVEKAVADNPYLKSQEKKIQNYVDVLLKMQVDMKKEK